MTLKLRIIFIRAGEIHYNITVGNVKYINKCDIFGKCYNLEDNVISMDNDLPNISDRKKRKHWNRNVLLKTCNMQLTRIYLVFFIS